MREAIKGIHHITAMTDSAERNYQFMTEILGMRLVKKTINQDDIYTYHTFYADDIGSPGSDVTFFDFPNLTQGQNGRDSISRIGLRVPSDQALDYYLARFEAFEIKHGEIEDFYGTKVLDFEEEDGQSYRLFSDEHNQGIEAGTPWQEGPVPVEMAIYGLGPIEVSVSYYDDFIQLVKHVYGFKERLVEEDITILEMASGGHGGQVIVRKDQHNQPATQGYGQVHHLALRVEDEAALEFWLEKYQKLGLPNSGIVERYYFKALYTRLGHILIELSTDGPGFMQDEPYESLGEKLSLPPYFEKNRQEIESQVRPFNTRRIK